MMKKLYIILIALLLPLTAFGQLSVPQGGTGRNSFTAGAFLYANSDAFQRITGTTSPFFSSFTFGTATGTSATTTNFFSDTASSTNLFSAIASFGTLSLPSLTSALTLTDANGLFAEYAGTSCTNQFVRSLSALGVATCATVGASDVSLAALTAGTGITSAGTYTGATARTFSVDQSFSPTWTGAHIFDNITRSTTTNATTTTLFSTTASSTNLFSSLLTVGGNGLVVNSSGNVSIGTSTPGGRLEVNRANDSGVILRLGTDGGSTTNFDFSRSASTGALSIQGNQTGANNIVLAPTSGNVGIGTASPGSTLDVGGNVTASGAGIFPRLSAATQGTGTYSGTSPRNLFTLNDGDAVILLVTGRSGSDHIWFGTIVRNVNLYVASPWFNQGVGGLTFAMSGDTLQSTNGSNSGIGFKFSYIRFPSF